MRIAVCVKQVPADSAAVMDPQRGVLLRSGVQKKMNPYDGAALAAARQLADAFGASLTAFSMGPPSARETLIEALAMGAQEAVLLCDPAFAGADVLATAHTLAQALVGFDCIVCGQQSTDGDTAQLPFSLAAQLNLPILGWVQHITEMDGALLHIEQEITGGRQMVQTAFPLVLAVGRETFPPPQPSLQRRLWAQKQEIRTLTLADLADTNAANYGLSGSPTRVTRIYAEQQPQRHPPLTLPAKEAAARILAELEAAR